MHRQPLVFSEPEPVGFTSNDTADVSRRGRLTEAHGQFCALVGRGLRMAQSHEPQPSLPE